MKEEKLRMKRAEQIIAFSNILSGYLDCDGNVSPKTLRQIKAYRFTFALMKSDKLLAPAASKFSEVITAVEQNNFKAATKLAAEAVALVEKVGG